MNNITSIVYRRSLCINKIKIKTTYSTNYMEQISLSPVYFINFLFCSNLPRVFSSFVTSSLFSSAFLFIAVALEIKDRVYYFSVLSTYRVNSFCSISLVFLSWSRLACTSFIS